MEHGSEVSDFIIVILYNVKKLFSIFNLNGQLNEVQQLF